VVNTNAMVTIGFSRATDEEKYQLYIQWLRSIDSTFDYINFFGKSIPEALLLLEKCSGLVVTGGPDVHPSHYNRSEEESRCECDPYRDDLEFALIDKALGLKLPLLAICRGEQILNVSMGGSLIVDIEADYGNAVSHKSKNEQLMYHRVNLDSTGNLYKIARAESFEVVSVHHQAVKTLAPCFRPTAFAHDKIVEAYEWMNPEGKGYLNAVQWHPEKGDFRNSLSRAIGKEFMEKVYAFASGRVY